MVRPVVVASLDIASRKADQQMRCAMIELHLVCVELLRRRIDVAQVILVRPIEEVSGNGRTNGTMPLRVPYLPFVVAAPGEISPVRALVSLLSIPEREVLRVKRSVGQDRFVAHR